LLILLPPSETKREGGTGAPLDLDALSFPQLNPLRRRLLASLTRLSRRPDELRSALKLGRTQDGEIAVTKALRTSSTLPAIDRYTGVLYDALGADTLSPDARAFAAEHLLVHSALFGLSGALDRVPAYRLSHDSRLTPLSLRSEWPRRLAPILAAHPGLVVDLRSEAYAALGAAPADHTVYVRVVSATPDGTVRALNHFNKTTKGVFARALLEAGQTPETADELVAVARSVGHDLRPGRDGEWELLSAH